MSNYYVDVDVLVNGKPVTVYSHEGDSFIEGRSGSEYSIRIKNKLSTRIEVVISVDGLSVIDGEAAGEGSTGYVLNGFQTVDIKGWRVSNESVAKFIFGDKEKSYTVKLGNGGSNAGVIGIMVFMEKYKPLPLLEDYWLPKKYTSSDWNQWNNSLTSRSISFGMNTSAPINSSFSGEANYNEAPTGYSGVATSADLTDGVASSYYTHPDTTVTMSATLNSLGTGMGEDTKSVVTNTTFERSSVFPLFTKSIYYDSRKGLEARGIVVDQRKLKPDAFPASQYCKRV